MTKRVREWFLRVSTGLGYCSLLLQWFFVVMLYIYYVSSRGWMSDILRPQPMLPPSSDIPYVRLEMPPMVDIVVVSVVIGVMVGVIVYAFRHLPRSIVRSGDVLTQVSAESIAPLVMSRRHYRTQKQRLRMTRQLIVFVKLGFAITPLLLLVPFFVIPAALPDAVLWIVALFLATTSCVWIAIEWCLGSLSLASSSK